MERVNTVNIKRKRERTDKPFCSLFFVDKIVALHNDDIHCLKLLFQILGEVVIRDDNVDIIGMGEGVRLNFADFRAIHHHVCKFGFFTNNFEKIRF